MKITTLNNESELWYVITDFEFVLIIELYWRKEMKQYI